MSAVVKANYSENRIIVHFLPGAPELLEAIRTEFEKIKANIPPRMGEGERDNLPQMLRKGLERLRHSEKIYKNNLVYSTQPNHTTMEKKKIRIFISYSSKDRELMELLRDGLKVHLSQHPIYTFDIWTDKEIDIGSNWKEKIENALEDSQAAVLLVSASFASSEFITKEELPVFFRKKKEEGYSLIPVLVRSYQFKNFESLSSLQFFKTYNEEYGFDTPIERDKLLPFDKLADDRKTTKKNLNDYYDKLACEILSVLTKPVEKNIIFHTKSENPKSITINDSKNEISTEHLIKLIDIDIDLALEKLFEIFRKNNGTFNDLYKEFISRPNSFEISSYRSRLKQFVRFNLDK